VLVAVYGTLKIGEANHGRLLPGREPAYRGFVEIPYLMYENGSYPMLVPAEKKHAIFVEIYDVDEATLLALDALEEPYDYWRETIHVDGLSEDVEIYVHPDAPPAGFTSPAPRTGRAGAAFPRRGKPRSGASYHPTPTSAQHVSTVKILK
jgi:gamma-glutamylcyclotransferase (GGCT)/AIG2-like uncharacterized protein YtfP